MDKGTEIANAAVAPKYFREVKLKIHRRKSDAFAGTALRVTV